MLWLLFSLHPSLSNRGALETPGKTLNELDVAMRVGQRSYVTVYDKIKAAQKAERVRADERAQAQKDSPG
jgi:hypothetical protein